MPIVPGLAFQSGPSMSYLVIIQKKTMTKCANFSPLGAQDANTKKNMWSL